MNNSELRELAKKIADAEYIIQTSQDQSRVKQAQLDIMELSGHISLFDLDILDEMIQENLKKS